MSFKNIVFYFIVGGTSATIFSFIENIGLKFILLAIILITAIIIDYKNKSKE